MANKDRLFDDNLAESTESSKMLEPIDVDMDKMEILPGKSSALGTFFGACCFPFTFCCSWFSIKEREEVVVLNCGRYVGTETEPGIHFRNCWGRELKRIPTAKITSHLPNTKVIDKNGNPLIVSGIVVYHFRNTQRAALDVLQAEQFVNNQAQVVMKQIVSRYPYEADEEGDGYCLKTEAANISREFVTTLQRQINVAGAQVHSFQFNNLSYAPEIAAGMLKRQQAHALVKARKTIVDGAVEIAHSAMVQLEERGITMQPDEKTRLVSNLLTVICAEAEIQPTLPLNFERGKQ